MYEDKSGEFVCTSWGLRLVSSVAHIYHSYGTIHIKSRSVFYVLHRT